MRTVEQLIGQLVATYGIGQKIELCSRGVWVPEQQSVVFTAVCEDPITASLLGILAANYILVEEKVGFRYCWDVFPTRFALSSESGPSPATRIMTDLVLYAVTIPDLQLTATRDEARNWDTGTNEERLIEQDLIEDIENTSLYRSSNQDARLKSSTMSNL